MKNAYYPVHVMNGYVDIVIYEVLVDAGRCSELACSHSSPVMLEDGIMVLHSIYSCPFAAAC